ncbi:39695_t:CDS:2, partial [Gigaspora margarita]
IIMPNLNQPILSSDLVNQFAQLLQQLQTVLTLSQAKFHQRSLKELPKGELIVTEVLKLYSTFQIGTSGHVNMTKSKNKEKIKPVNSLPKVSLENEKQEKKKPKNGKQEVPRERMNEFQNDGNNQKRNNKKNTFDNYKI